MTQHAKTNKYGVKKGTIESWIELRLRKRDTEIADMAHSRSEPQDLSGPHWALVAGFRALESAFFKGVVDLVDRCEPGRS